MDAAGLAAATPAPGCAARHSDICVIGGGIPALVFVRLLQQRQPQLKITVLDAGGAGGSDGKTIVVDYATATCLQSLGALPAESHPINEVQIKVGRLPGKTLRGGAKPLGYAISPREVLSQLRQGVTMETAQLKAVEVVGEHAELTTQAGEVWQTPLAVVACPLEALPPPFRTRRFAYRQTVLSLRASGGLPRGTARQRFSRRRVLVLVPRAEDDDIGVIICAADADAGSLNAMPDAELSATLSREFDLPLMVHGARFAYTPQLARRSPMAAPPLLLLGGGATTLHPIGAQAISLAVEDAQQLAAAFSGGEDGGAGKGGGIPAAAGVESYQRRIHAHRGKALLTSTLALGAFGAGGLF